MEVSSFAAQKIKILESSSPVDVSQHCLAILEAIIQLEKPDQQKFADILYEWAAGQKKRKPLLYCYARLVRAFTIFYNENYDNAFPLITWIYEEFNRLGDPDGAALCMVIQGGIYRTFGTVDLALQSSLAAYSRLSQSKASPHFFMACCINIGNIYLERQHYEEAIPLFRETLDLAERSGKYYWMIYALHGLGKVYTAQKKYDEAKDCLEKAMQTSERFNNAVSQCNSLSEFGNYYFATGNFQEAEQFHRRSLNLREQNKFYGGAITSCTRLAEIYMKTGAYDKALAVLEKGLELANQIKVKLKMYQLHRLLSEVYEKQHDTEKSLHHFKQFYELREEVEKEDNERKIKNAQMVFEAEQTKKENVMIKKQKEEIARKNIELQETIDMLTRAKIGKKARAITLIIAIALFIMEDFILHFALAVVNSDNYFISIIVKMVIIFSLSPINKAIESYLLKKVVRKKREVLV